MQRTAYSAVPTGTSLAVESTNRTARVRFERASSQMHGLAEWVCFDVDVHRRPTLSRSAVLGTRCAEVTCNGWDALSVNGCCWALGVDRFAGSVPV